MSNHLFRTKAMDRLVSESERPEHQLKRALGALDLTALGIGAIIGAGIFALTGTAAAGSADRLGAGPAIIFSFVLSGTACGFAALCYAEMASMIPVAGSAYTYSYATMGELVAWIIGWDLILEYMVGNVAVAVSWASHLVELLHAFDISLPGWMIRNSPGAPPDALINIPAMLIVAFITGILVIGIQESARFNSIAVAVKLVVIVFFIALGAFYVKPSNWTPFAPNGFPGIGTGAAIVFFAYIGFDAVSTAAEEARNPQRDLPIGMIASLVVCTVLYIAVAAVLTGMVPYTELNNAAPVATALSSTGLRLASAVVSAGALAGMTSVLLVFQLGQPRIFFSMARDGLLSRKVSVVHPRFRTPHVTTLITGAIVTAFCGFTEISIAADLTNIGTLFAFVLVCAGVLVLRRADPGRKRPFRCPAVPVVPVLGIVFCTFLMYQLPHLTWVRFVVWLFIGLMIYFLYGIDHSTLYFEALKADRGIVDTVARTRNLLGVICLLVAGVVLYGGTMEHGTIGNAVAYAIGADQTSRPFVILSLVGLGVVVVAAALFYKARRVNVTE